MRDFIKFGPWVKGKTWYVPKTVNYLSPAVEFSYRPFGQVFLPTCVTTTLTEKVASPHE